VPTSSSSIGTKRTPNKDQRGLKILTICASVPVGKEAVAFRH